MKKASVREQDVEDLFKGELGFWRPTKNSWQKKKRKQRLKK